MHPWLLYTTQFASCPTLTIFLSSSSTPRDRENIDHRVNLHVTKLASYISLIYLALRTIVHSLYRFGFVCLGKVAYVSNYIEGITAQLSCTVTVLMLNNSRRCALNTSTDRTESFEHAIVDCCYRVDSTFCDILDIVEVLVWWNFLTCLTLLYLFSDFLSDHFRTGDQRWDLSLGEGKERRRCCLSHLHFR